MDIRTVMRLAPVIPVIVVDSPEQAVPLARALVAGGLPVLEVTLRTAAALPAIEAIAAEVEGAVLGVGTVVRPAQFEASRRAGATFAVTPGLTPTLAAAAKDCGLPLLPGVMTPGEVIAAGEAGFDALKLFRIGYSWAGATSLVMLYDLPSMRSLPQPWRGGLVRFSIGLEDPDDLIADLEQALRALA